MDLVAEVQQEIADSHKGEPCSVRVLLDRLPPEDAEQVNAIVDDKTAMATAVSRVLARHEIKLSDSTIRRHRRRECQCP